MSGSVKKGFGSFFKLKVRGWTLSSFMQRLMQNENHGVCWALQEPAISEQDPFSLFISLLYERNTDRQRSAQVCHVKVQCFANLVVHIASLPEHVFGP